MNLDRTLITFCAAIMLIGCEKNPYGPTGYQPDVQKPDKEDQHTPPPAEKGGYAKGADISWLTQMEGDGQKFYTSDGKEMECTALMKELGFNSIRLRVWVNPEGGWCAKEDVLVKAKRAQELRMTEGTLRMTEETLRMTEETLRMTAEQRQMSC